MDMLMEMVQGNLMQGNEVNLKLVLSLRVFNDLVDVANDSNVSPCELVKQLVEGIINERNR